MRGQKPVLQVAAGTVPAALAHEWLAATSGGAAWRSE